MILPMKNREETETYLKEFYEVKEITIERMKATTSKKEIMAVVKETSEQVIIKLREQKIMRQQDNEITKTAWGVTQNSQGNPKKMLPVFHRFLSAH